MQQNKEKVGKGAVEKEQLGFQMILMQRLRKMMALRMMERFFPPTSLLLFLGHGLFFTIEPMWHLSWRDERRCLALWEVGSMGGMEKLFEEEATLSFCPLSLYTVVVVV